MVGFGISCLYLHDSGILGIHQPPFGNNDKAAWLQPSSCPGNPLPLVLCKGATHNHCCTRPFTVLHYPDKNVVVWIHDANVSLAKYIPLALVAMLFLLFLFLPYTLLLLLGQWLQTISITFSCYPGSEIQGWRPFLTPTMLLTSQSINIGLGGSFCFTVLYFLLLPSTLVEIRVLTFLSFLQLLLELL